jgi:cytochrome c-type biogenesis protein CcmF
MGDATNDGGRAIRLYFNPLVNFIWLGTFIMFLGGLLSLSDRRYRVGAPKRHAFPRRRCRQNEKAAAIWLC